MAQNQEVIFRVFFWGLRLWLGGLFVLAPLRKWLHLAVFLCAMIAQVMANSGARAVCVQEHVVLAG